MNVQLPSSATVIVPYVPATVCATTWFWPASKSPIVNCPDVFSADASSPSATAFDSELTVAASFVPVTVKVTDAAVFAFPSVTW